MTTDPAPSGASLTSKVAVAAVSVMAFLGIAFVVIHSKQRATDADDVIRLASAHISQVPPSDVDDRSDDLAAWALDLVHEASAEPDPTLRRAKLGRVASGDALQSLDEGLLAVNGLEVWPEAFHETEIMEQAAIREDYNLSIQAIWRPVGLIDGDLHRHRAGNSFSGRLEFAWMQDMWRLTGITIASVDDSAAGQIVKAVQEKQ